MTVLQLSLNTQLVNLVKMLGEQHDRSLIEPLLFFSSLFLPKPSCTFYASVMLFTYTSLNTLFSLSPPYLCTYLPLYLGCPLLLFTHLTISYISWEIQFKYHIPCLVNPHSVIHFFTFYPRIVFCTQFFKLAI